MILSKLGVNFTGESGRKRNLGGLFGLIVSLFAITMSAYHLYTAVYGTPEWILHRPLHVMFFLVIGFFLFKGSKRDTPFKFIIDCVLALAALSIYLYILYHYERIAEYQFMVSDVTTLDYVVGVTMILLVLEMTRRTTGWALICVALVFMADTLFTKYLPGALRGPSIPWQTYVEYMFFTSDGLFGSTVNISASYVFLFVVFGAFLEDTGVGQYFIDIAAQLTSRARGGSAKASILASGLFGSISGSAVANVYATGTFTIPMMKKTGFSAAFAGATEAVASSGGAIMPPVMGSAAFLMADFLGIPYAKIAVAAFLPAILYYLSLWFIVDLEAVKFGMKKGGNGEKIDWWGYVKRSYMILPIVTVIVFIVQGYTAFMAAFYAILVTLVVGFIHDPKCLSPVHILKTLDKAGRSAVTIAAPLTCAAIIVGSIQLTGVGLKLTSMIVKIANGIMPIALFLTMIITIILGMGLPTPAAYLLVAIFAPSALANFGVAPLTSHMFCFYYAAFSTITPPVAMAAYAGGNLAGAPVNKTGFTAMKIGIAAYIIPWVFVFSDGLLMRGPVLGIVQSFVTAVIGVYCLACGVQGMYFEKNIGILLRAALLAASVCMIVTGTLTDAIGVVIAAAVFTAVKLSK